MFVVDVGEISLKNRSPNKNCGTSFSSFNVPESYTISSMATSSDSSIFSDKVNS